MENYRILVGAVENGDLLFANFGISNAFGSPELKESWDIVRPFNATDYNKKEGIESYLEHCFSEEEKQELCEKYHCTQSSLVETLAKEWDITEIVNCDDYDFCITIDGKVWRFEYIDTIPLEMRCPVVDYVDIEIHGVICGLQNNPCEKTANEIEQQVKEAQTFCDKFKSTEEQWIIEHIRKHLM